MTWTSQDFRSVVSGGRINDIDFVSPEVTWIASDGEIVKHENDIFETIIEDNINRFNAFHQDKSGNQWIHYTRITSDFLAVRRDGDYMK